MAASCSSTELLFMILVWLKLLSTSSPYVSPAGYWLSCRFFCHATLVVLPHRRNNELTKTHHVQSFENFVKEVMNGPDSLMWGC